MENRSEEQPVLLLDDKTHVIILREKLAKRKCDRYLLNMALAYQQLGNKVTLCTSQYNQIETFDDIKVLEKISLVNIGWWIPRSIFGLLYGKMSAVKALYMAFKVAFSFPNNEYTLIVTDISLVALYVLHLFTNCRIYYVESFEQLRYRYGFCEHATYSPSLCEAKFIKLADEIILESAPFAEIFRKSFPAVPKEPLILYPAIDIGLWQEECIQIQRIIPDLLDNTTLFLSIGKYRRTSNFKLALDAFEILLHLIADIEVTKRFQLVIAGNCKSLEEKLHYNELVSLAKERLCASQVSFLNQLPIVHEKTLIMECAIAIYSSRSDVHADFILKAMSLGKPIVATNKGIAPKLLQNRITGIMTEPEPNAMAQVMRKLMMSPHLQSFMGEIARDVFQKNYSFKSFAFKLAELNIKHKEKMLKNTPTKTVAVKSYGK
ncbi:hypothetical protein ABEB36_000773 [Hypothenemus hampei]|uniref:Alpha-1,3/1,6-mannosyltransferase ALG2 n=1 Tax=Hypothenemus hampei TaxID=57062 RepID=A0ABD1FCD5_HYPHA